MSITIDLDEEAEAMAEEHAKVLGFTSASEWSFVLLRDNLVASKVTLAFFAGDRLHGKEADAIHATFGLTPSEQKTAELNAKAIADYEAVLVETDVKVVS